jgi:preprotein translocase subunit YajC
MNTLILVAQDSPAPEGGNQPAENPMGIFGNPLLMMLLIGLFIVVVVLPGSRRQKREQQAMLAALKPGAKVVTAAGIIGTVVKVKENEDEITVKSEDTKLKVLKSTVVRVLGEETAEAK